MTNRGSRDNGAHGRPSEVSAVDGIVFVDGPANTAISFTPAAAKETSRRLADGAATAARQKIDAHISEKRSTPSTIPYALVVDDDALVLMTVCDMLENAGFRFFEAGSADEALPVLEANWESVTLLFTDVEMPGALNGYSLAHHVATRWPGIEIVVASGNAKPAGGDLPDRATFIPKPFNEQIVHDHLRRILPDGKKPEKLRTPI